MDFVINDQEIDDQKVDDQEKEEIDDQEKQSIVPVRNFKEEFYKLRFHSIFILISELLNMIC